MKMNMNIVCRNCQGLLKTTIFVLIMVVLSSAVIHKIRVSQPLHFSVAAGIDGEKVSLGEQPTIDRYNVWDYLRGRKPPYHENQGPLVSVVFAVSGLVTIAFIVMMIVWWLRKSPRKAR